MIPAWLPALVLTLGAFRITRLVGWDDLPPIRRARAFVLGETWETETSVNGAIGVTADAGRPVVRYRRPLLAHFVHCAFCLGFWVSAAAYVSWYFEPVWTKTVLAPFAISAAVGLIAKRLDP